MRTAYRLLLFALLCGMASMAQMPPVVNATLGISKDVPSAEPGGSFIGILRCDDEGSVYFRTYDQTLRGKEPIKRLTAKGVKTASFDVASVTEVPGMRSGQFAVGSKGDVDELAWDKDVFLVHYDQTGKYQGKTYLDARFIPYSVAVFPTGRFLVTGLQPPTTTEPFANRLFTALFDNAGHVLKQIVFSDDDAITAAAARGDSNFVRSSSLPDGNYAVAFGAAFIGADGNAYVMRRVSPAIIYAVSPNGTVLRRFIVDPGKAGLEPSTMEMDGNSIALMFWDNVAKEMIVRIVDAPSGNVTATYNGVGASIGAALACYRNNVFTFLGSNNNKLLLHVVTPQP